MDFAFVPPQHDSPGLLRIWEAFDRVGPQLAELYHSGAPHYWKNGVRHPISQMAGAITKGHHNHVHVGVRKGTFLQWTGPPLNKPEVEDDMPEYLIFPSPTGGYWALQTIDGGVGAYGGAPFFGSLPGIKVTPNARPVCLTPFGQDGLVKGYWITCEDGGVFPFGAAPFLGAYAGHPEWHTPGAKVVGLTQTDGYDTGRPVRYKLMRREQRATAFAFQGYEFPL